MTWETVSQAESSVTCLFASVVEKQLWQLVGLGSMIP